MGIETQPAPGAAPNQNLEPAARRQTHPSMDEAVQPLAQFALEPFQSPGLALGIIKAETREQRHANVPDELPPPGRDGEFL